MSLFASRLRYLMATHWFTTYDIEKKTGISNYQILRYSKGQIDASLKNAVKIANLFNCSLDYLIGTDPQQDRFEDYGGLDKEPDFDKFIERYYYLLNIRNLNHNKVASDNGYNHNNIIYWEKKRVFPSIEILYRLSIYFHRPIEYLVGRYDIKK